MFLVNNNTVEYTTQSIRCFGHKPEIYKSMKSLPPLDMNILADVSSSQPEVDSMVSERAQDQQIQLQPFRIFLIEKVK